LATAYNSDTLRAKKVLTFYDLYPSAESHGVQNAEFEVESVSHHNEYNETRIVVRRNDVASVTTFSYAFATGLVMVVHEKNISDSGV